MRSLRGRLWLDAGVAIGMATLLYLVVTAWLAPMEGGAAERASLRKQANDVARALRPQPAGGLGIDRDALRGWFYDAYPDRVKFRVLDAQNRVLVTSDGDTQPLSITAHRPERDPSSTPVLVQGDPAHVLSQRAHIAGTDVTIQVARDSAFNALIAQMTDPLRIETAVGTALFIAIFLAVALTRSLRRGLLAVQHSVSSLFHAAPSVHRWRHLAQWPSELAPLARATQRHIARLYQQRANEQRAMAETVHDAKTALSVLRATTELYMPHAQRDAALLEIDELTMLLSALHAARPAGVFAIERCEKACLGAITHQVVERLSVLATSRHVQLVVHSVDTPGTVFGDSSALLIAVQNIVHNAIKFSPPHHDVTIDIGERAIRVVNEGQGLPDVPVSQLFRRFWTGDSPNSGMGLGLAIVKDVMDAHGACVVVERHETRTRVSLLFEEPFVQGSGNATP